MIIANVFSDENELRITMVAEHPSTTDNQTLITKLGDDWAKALDLVKEANPDEWDVGEVIEMMQDWGWKISGHTYPVLELEY